MDKQIGQFHAKIGPPYPVWIEIVAEYGDGYLRCDHQQLRDLEHAVKELIAETNRLLPEKDQI